MNNLDFFLYKKIIFLERNMLLYLPFLNLAFFLIFFNAKNTVDIIFKNFTSLHKKIQEKNLLIFKYARK